MRIAQLAQFVLVAHCGVAVANPHGTHDKLHSKRRSPMPSFSTEVVTVTDYNAIVWVDHRGSIIRTEYKNAAHMSSPSSSVVAVSEFALPTSAVQQSNAAMPSVKNASPPSVLSTSPVSSPATATEAESQSTAAASGDTNVANKQIGNNHGAANSNQAGNNNIPVASNVPSSSNIASGFGICYDPIGAGNSCKSISNINSDFGYLKSQGYAIVRVYDIACPLGDYAAAASSNGLRLMIGLNSIANLASDLGQLITMVGGQWGPVDTVYIGNELVNSGAASASAVAGAVSSARGTLSAAGFSGNVITVDTFNQLMINPTICSTSSYCGANAHAFFDPNTAAAGAGTFVRNAYSSVQAANQGKAVVITESGWPWQGSCNGAACPSEANQLTALNAIKAEFAGQPNNLFFFQAYDATYKQPGSLGVEQFFGIYDSDHFSGGF